MKTLTRADKTFEIPELKTKTRYVVAHDGARVFHAIELLPYLQVTTGLKFLESFDSIDDAKKKFADVSFEPGSDILSESING